MTKILLAPAFLIIALSTTSAVNAPLEPKIEEFPLGAVRIDESSPFYKAMRIDRTYLLSLDYDRLLSHMRKAAGLAPKAPPYGNWEGKSWTIGHAMSALSMLYAATGDKEALEKLNYAADGVAECQHPETGFVAQNDWCWKMYEDIANNPAKDEQPQSRWQLAGVKEYKVPFYYVHKLNAGLLDAWRYAGNEKAKKTFLKHCDWICSYMDRFTDAQFENVLYVEHGGLNETLAEAAAIARNKADAEKYLRNAKKFSHKEMLVPFAEGKDILPKLHANTQIPKFVGFRRIADLSKDQQYADAARNFWNIVVDTQTFSLGGNSIGEHFPEANQFDKTLSRTAGPETCNSYNMLKLTEGLFRPEPVAKYADYYERTLFNHILSSQDNDSPEGGFVYYTQLRPMAYRVFSKVHDHFWCCVGTGLENHVKYGKFLYAHSADALYVNLFVPSTVTWKEKDITLSQKTRFPDEEGTEFTIQTPKKSVDFTLRIRKPEWVAGNALKVSVNGKEKSLNAGDDGFVALTRAWKNGDTVAVSLPMHIRLEPLKGAEPFYAFLYGPILLAQRNGTKDVPAFKWAHQFGNGLTLPIGNMPFLKVSPQDLPGHIRKNPGEKLSFRIDPAIMDKADAIELVPFNEIYEERYTMYFPVGDDKALAAYRAKYKMLESSDREKVLARAVDSMILGWQQPETDHSLKSGEKSWAGYFRDELPFRSAQDWFAAMFAAPEGQFQKGMKLAVFTEIHGSIGGRSWEIAVNGQPIATETLKEKSSDKLEIREYPIPQEIVDASNGKIEIKITCREKEAGPIFKMGILRSVPTAANPNQ
ncbi:MAG: beta-L-arabinofuranosidase domain-containing protein [Verrucomicrobiota bacterium]